MLGISHFTKCSGTALLLIFIGLATCPALILARTDISTTEKAIVVVTNQGDLVKRLGEKQDLVLEACRLLLKGKTEQILDGGKAYEGQFGKALGIESYPSAEANGKARWLREWLCARVPQGSTIVLLGDEKSLPVWQFDLEGMQFTTDSPYSDLDGDGVPETAVCRVLGPPEIMVRQLLGKGGSRSRAVILCSEDTRIHLETRAFAKHLAHLGCDVSIRGARDDEALTRSDFIIHFGHGEQSSISNRFGESFVTASAIPTLSHSPIVFVDGCGTLPVGSPLLHSFLKQGAIGYVGSTATVQGMTPARFTNELVEHFLRIHAEQPRSSIPLVLTITRATYIQGHPGLSDKLRQLAATGKIVAFGEELTDLLTAAEWVYYGDPRAVMPKIGSPKEMSRQAFSLAKSIHLNGTNRSWQTSFETKPDDGQVTLALYTEVPISDRDRFSISIRQSDKEISVLDGLHDTVYQRIGRDCRGGYVCGDTYRARFLLPLSDGQGQQQLEVRLVKGMSAVLTPGTEVDVWPPDFEKKIGLRQVAPTGRPIGIRIPTRREPIRVGGVAKLRSTGVPGFLALDISSMFNRPHSSILVGGGDNASFRTWFSEDKVSDSGVPFLVERTGNDVLVSENNTQNVYEIKGIEASARALHFLIWGYMYPRDSARLQITFGDGSSQECELPLSEWTRAVPPVAFDFENTVPSFKHTAVAHQVVKIADPEKKIAAIISNSGTYGLIAITLQQN
jgi:hypothetical protein